MLGDELLSDERLETEIEPGRVWKLGEFCGLDGVPQTVDEMTGPVFGIDRHDRVKYAGDVLF